MSKPAAVIGKLVLKGEIVAQKPLIIGSGNNDLADIEVLRDEAGKPFIPATSFVGVLRHCIEGESFNTDPHQSKYFWGSKTDNGAQSALCCHDLSLRTDSKAEIRIRDGVAIDSKTGIAKDKHKYDYEVIEPGASFDMHLEVTVREEFDKELFSRILATMVDLLKSGDTSFGAKTTSGFGRCKLEDMKYCEFDFSEEDDVWRWLKQDFSQDTKIE
ncbi:MAG: RAMP superfamily CRISPR-associated protein, partial [Candidatus Desantisbacteria bacterium]